MAEDADDAVRSLEKTGRPGVSGREASSFFLSPLWRRPVFFKPPGAPRASPADAPVFFLSLLLGYPVFSKPHLAAPGPESKGSTGLGCPDIPCQRRLEKNWAASRTCPAAASFFFLSLPSFFPSLLRRRLPACSDPASFFLKPPGPSFFQASFWPVLFLDSLL